MSFVSVSLFDFWKHIEDSGETLKGINGISFNQKSDEDAKPVSPVINECKDSFTCISCKKVFHSSEEQRNHFKSEEHQNSVRTLLNNNKWYCKNMKIMNNEEESSDSDDESEINQSEEDQQPDKNKTVYFYSQNHKYVLYKPILEVAINSLALLRKNLRSTSWKWVEENDDKLKRKASKLNESSIKKHISMLYSPDGKINDYNDMKLFIHDSPLISGNYSIFNSFTTGISSELLQDPFNKFQQAEWQLIINGFSNIFRCWSLILLSGGHLALCIFLGNRLVLHHTEHRYTVRKKQGKSQMSYDSNGSLAQSAGAEIRRYNQKMLEDTIKNLLKVWREPFLCCSHIIYYAPGRNKNLLIGPHPIEESLVGDFNSINLSKQKQNPLFSRDDPRLISMPVIARRPTIEEAMRIHAQLTYIAMEKIDFAEIINQIPKTKEKKHKDAKNDVKHFDLKKQEKKEKEKEKGFDSFNDDKLKTNEPKQSLFIPKSSPFSKFASNSGSPFTTNYSSSTSPFAAKPNISTSSPFSPSSESPFSNLTCSSQSPFSSEKNEISKSNLSSFENLQPIKSSASYNFGLVCSFCSKSIPVEQKVYENLSFVYCSQKCLDNHFRELIK